MPAPDQGRRCRRGEAGGRASRWRQPGRGDCRAGIPIVGHIGLTPQTAGLLGGFKVQGQAIVSARALLADADGDRRRRSIHAGGRGGARGSWRR